MIEGVVVTPLRQMVDERGKVMHMLRSDSAVFSGFGEIYFSTVHPGAIKGWHIHKRMVLNYAVPHGCIKFVLYDDRAESATCGELQEIFLGPDNYCLVTVPPLVWKRQLSPIARRFPMILMKSNANRLSILRFLTTGRCSTDDPASTDYRRLWLCWRPCRASSCGSRM